MLRYVLTFVGLLLLTGLTLGLSFTHLGPFNTVISMAIAIAKTVLIVLFFMHMIEERAATRMTLVVGLILALTLMSLSALDVVSRPSEGPTQAQVDAGP